MGRSRPAAEVAMTGVSVSQGGPNGQVGQSALLAAIRKPARSLLQESLINLKEEELLALRDAMRPLIAQLTPSLAKHHLTPISPFTELVENSKDQALDS